MEILNKNVQLLNFDYYCATGMKAFEIHCQFDASVPTSTLSVSIQCTGQYLEVNVWYICYLLSRQNDISVHPYSLRTFAATRTFRV